MWNDVETTQDLLNFKVVADAAAQIIKDGGGQPVTVGISGSWGAGKSSLVQMIGESLKKSDTEKRYIFVNFNAWLYQGYDDARMALLQKVADKIMEEAQARNSFIDRAKEFIMRVNWLRAAKVVAPVVIGSMSGGILADPIGSFISTISNTFTKETVPTPEEVNKLQEDYNQIAPDFQKILKDKETKSVPKEIEKFRVLFQEILESLNLNLIVLVDDLDRCLPDTAISTLEAMRLLLLVPQTAFIIAADEQMIRNAVRSHFGNIDLSDALITSYFDKLIQIPLRVPRLGINEVKCYLILLLADLAHRRGKITETEKRNGHEAIIGNIRKSWAGGLTKKVIESAYGDAALKISIEIDLADQLATIMTTSEHIAGNPRLIKRFLNNLIIRESIAKAQGMGISFEALVKIQLFERCAPAGAFEYLAKEVGECENGKPAFLQDIEDKIAKAEEIPFIHESWKGPFILEWLKLSPPLSELDLRPLLYLSRDKAISMASFDELSSDGRELLLALCEADGILPALVTKLKSIGVVESEKILTRMKRKARSKQWDSSIIIQALHIPKAFPELSNVFLAMLDEIPSTKISPVLVPLLQSDEWAKNLLSRWIQDDNTPQPVKRAIRVKRK